MARCDFCGAYLSEAEFDMSIENLEDESMLCSRHLAEAMGWLDYGELTEI